jgi:hypothetical protein
MLSLPLQQKSITACTSYVATKRVGDKPHCYSIHFGHQFNSLLGFIGSWTILVHSSNTRCRQTTMSLTPRLIVCYFAFQAVHAVPISEAEDITRRAQPDNCGDIDQCRTMWNIIWSCLATIFACTWLALHLNIPAPDDGWLKIALRKVGTMVMAVLAPEFLVLWALRQSFAAHRIAKRMFGFVDRNSVS